MEENENVTLTLRELEKSLVDEIKQESKILGMPPSKFISCLCVLYFLRCRFTPEQLKQAGLRLS